jgi:hypothetical protein
MADASTLKRGVPPSSSSEGLTAGARCKENAFGASVAMASRARAIRVRDARSL